MIVANEPISELLQVMGIPENNEGFSRQMAETASARYLRDLKLNLKSSLYSELLTEKESMLLALALSVNSGKQTLQAAFHQKSLEAGATHEQVGEAIACASLMAANNVFYRFRHVMQDEKYNNIPAKFRMSIMMNPVNGKEFFELMSLAISAVNGCEMCVRSHEQSLRTLGCSQERIFEAVRLASIMESTSRFF